MSGKGDAKGTGRLGHVLRDRREESWVIVDKGAIHAWNLQSPKLFARGIEVWIEESCQWNLKEFLIGLILSSHLS
jgi:hypothetical protein